MSVRFVLLLLTAFTYTQLRATEPLIQNVYNRPAVSLNGYWKYIVDPYENGFYNYRYQPFEKQAHPSKGAFFTNSRPADKADLVEYDFDGMDSLLVPGDWNTQKENLYYYEGTVWYKKSFDYHKMNRANRIFLWFGAANYQADVYLNGKKLGRHVGGFTPFNFEITDLVRAKGNFLIVKVDNKRKKDGVPTLNTDWWNYGGLTRDVKLIEMPPLFIRDYRIQLDPSDSHTIQGNVILDGQGSSGRQVRISIPGLKRQYAVTTDSSGRTSFTFKVDSLRYWSPQDPFLYKVYLQAGRDSIHDQIGFRAIRTRGAQILLNDKPVFLKGISIHEEQPFGGGRGLDSEQAAELLRWAQELGCNYVRLAHYPHNEYMVRQAERLGLLVWEEIPVYWTIDWENEATWENARNQLAEVIARDKNRSSVIIWSMANETPNVPARNRFLSRLAAFARAQDPTRLISAALEQKQVSANPNLRTIDDPFAESVDVLSFNQYIGWYDGLPEKCTTTGWQITQNKPVIISEFGAGAKQGLHGDSRTRWTEEFQEDVYIQTLRMVDKIGKLAGMSPWILVDFRSPRRVLPGIQDGYNRKGLISDDGKKKKAFYILQEFYNRK